MVVQTKEKVCIINENYLTTIFGGWYSCDWMFRQICRLLHELLKWNDVVKMKHMLRTNVTHFSKSDNTFFVICFISNVQIHAERHFVLSKHKKSISAVKIEADT